MEEFGNMIQVKERKFGRYIVYCAEPTRADKSDGKNKYLGYLNI